MTVDYDEMSRRRRGEGSEEGFEMEDPWPIQGGGESTNEIGLMGWGERLTERLYMNSTWF